MEIHPDLQIVRLIEAHLTRDPRIKNFKAGMNITCEGGHVTLAGRVPTVAAKRLAPRLARTVKGVRTVEDQLRVAVAGRMGDKEILRHIRDAFRQERNLEEQYIVIETDAEGGVILRGVVHALAQRRMSEVLSWWVPGVTSVRNLIVVDPPEEDSDDELKDNLLVIMDKDMLVDPKKFLLDVHGGVVTLRGRVDSPVSKDAAEKDCWYTPGVVDVVNLLTE